ncbi:MAG: serine/threonine protein kinase [Mariniblastus sp.]|jgi:serine/threonine protein kinase
MNYPNSKLKSCPTPALLSEFSIGLIGDVNLSEEISSHIESCSTCVDRIADYQATRQDSDTHASYWKHSNGQADESPSFGDNPGSTMGQAKSGAMGQSGEDHLEFETRIIGPYKLERKIGVGGMGVVYQALHLDFNYSVALKVLPASRIGNQQASRRFELEMQTAQKLTHPNVVVSYDAGEADGHCYLAMELLEGVDLSKLARTVGASLTISNACELVRQAALGVGYAHQRNIVHRDVKPSNIMLCLDRSPSQADAHEHHPVTVKLLDLGLARCNNADNKLETMTSTNQIMGTIEYMSPEQCLDSREVTPRSDIYSLGATLFRLLADRAIWNDPKHQTQGQKLKALLSETTPSLGDVRPDLPAELIAIVDRAIKHDAAERFSNTQEFISALSPFAAAHTLPALFESVIQKRATQAARKVQPQVSQISTASSWGNRPTRPSDRPTCQLATRKGLALAGLSLAVMALAIMTLRQFGSAELVTDRLNSSINRHEVAKWILTHDGDFNTGEHRVRKISDIPAGDFNFNRIAIRNADDEKVRQICDWLIHMPKCERLYLNGGTAKLLTDHSIPFLDQAKHLKWLTIESARVTDEGVAQLNELPQLRTLGLLDLLVTEKCLNAVQENFPQLTKLDIDSDSLSGSDLSPLAGMKQLRSFDLNSPFVSPELLSPLVETSVDLLTIRGVLEFEDGVGDLLANIPELIDFSLQNSNFGDEQLAALSKSPKLKFIRLSNSKITTEGVKAFIAQRPDVVVYVQRPKSPLLKLRNLPQVKDVTGR